MLHCHFLPTRGLWYALLFIILLPSCGSGDGNIKEREEELSQKQAELVQKEQQLQAKEKELKNTELILDSTRRQIDAANIYNADITGKWTVKMNCTETSCEGSAIGDTKTETWEISYRENNKVTVNAYADKKLIRTYTGYYKASGLHLADEQYITVTLLPLHKEKMEGTREITQPNCKIIYNLAAEKLK